MKTPTIELYEKMESAFNFYNEAIFSGELKPVLFTVRSPKTSSSDSRVLGYYWQKVFAHKGVPLSEIALNIETFYKRTTIEILSTLVHEMVHQWRAEIEGSEQDPKYGGHDIIWANKMEEIGLIPSNTGEPGGKRIAKKMTHYIDENGKFCELTKELIKSGFAFDIFDNYASKMNMLSTFIKLNPIIPLIAKKWAEGEEGNELSDDLRKSLGILHEDENIIKSDLIENIIIPVKPPVKIRVKKCQYVCNVCETELSAPEGSELYCLKCENNFTLKQRIKKIKKKTK